MTSLANVFDDDLMSSDLFLELESVSPLSHESGDVTPSSTFEFDQLAAANYAYPTVNTMQHNNIKYDESAPILIPGSPDSTRPSSPTSSVNSATPYTSKYPSSLANSNLSEEEKERIRREKKREADRKCRKRKKERINDMENKMRRLEDERRHLISKVDMLERARAVSPSVAAGAGSDSNSFQIAQSAVNSFNADLPSIASFTKSYTSDNCEVISQAGVTQGKDAFVQQLISMKKQFPDSSLKIVSVKDESANKLHLTWTITGMLSNGKPLNLDGHSFVTVVDGLIVKNVCMWDAMSVMAQMLGMSQSELVEKSESASHFEDFIL
ncbi:hypothetical protein TL16_g01621 [Triparma laevis f. inornata]|uniref:BZIP domain-containing protein n=2 Tax=Triparma laevis TaxID=1534972 RepID=A0A9W7KZ83_9STRA|nr:hypothetical protein TL16_g01621 [Triparma laevis f. inornata]GMI16610.1 hypothetical protein TrLO_g15630 [Triparma laevis f. longispina]